MSARGDRRAPPPGTLRSNTTTTAFGDPAPTGDNRCPGAIALTEPEAHLATDAVCELAAHAVEAPTTSATTTTNPINRAAHEPTDALRVPPDGIPLTSVPSGPPTALVGTTLPEPDHARQTT